MSYYDRKSAVHIDGSPIFQTAEDRAAEEEVAMALRTAWGCDVSHYGQFSPIDWYTSRKGRLTGQLELKSRSHPSTEHPTVFLNVRKWLALMMGSVGMGIPGGFVVKFTDALLWISISKVDARRFKISGCSYRVKSESDIEPVILVPITEMKVLVPPRKDAVLPA